MKPGLLHKHIFRKHYLTDEEKMELHLDIHRSYGWWIVKRCRCGQEEGSSYWFEDLDWRW